jgi:hypothetical protein
LGQGSGYKDDLAVQLSNIFLVDALNGQWDRFSGGNLQYAIFNGRASFVSNDNGGTEGGENYFKLVTDWVTRFSKPVAERILAMSDFLQGKSPKFLNFENRTQLRLALGMREGVPMWSTKWEKMQSRVTRLADHIRSKPGCYFASGGGASSDATVDVKPGKFCIVGKSGTVRGDANENAASLTSLPEGFEVHIRGILNGSWASVEFKQGENAFGAPAKASFISVKAFKSCK